MMDVVYFFVALTASAFGAISGIGGGVLIKPAMTAASGFSVAQISFMSGCTVLSMATVSLFLRGGAVRTDGAVDKKTGTLLAVGSILGGFAGKAIFNAAKNAAASDSALGLLQSVLLVAMVLGVYAYTVFDDRIPKRQVKNAAASVTIGFALGTLSAFLGIGGGPLNLAVLSYFFSMSRKNAAVNSIYLIFLSQLASLVLTLCQRTVPQVDWLALSLMVLGGVAGGRLGSRLRAVMKEKTVVRVFQFVMILIVAISAYNIARYTAAL